MNSLRNGLQEYLALRRRLGFKLEDAGERLQDFVAFMERNRTSRITSQLALRWARLPDSSPANWAQRLCYVRGFARHRSASDPRTQIPPASLLPHRPARARPYLYTDEEVRSLLDAALSTPPGKRLQPWTCYCLLGLLSVTGLRFVEARNLQLQDVDLEAALLTVRHGKFGKSRLVPLHASTCKVLTRYLTHRERWLAGKPDSPCLFMNTRGEQLEHWEMYAAFVALSRQVGLRAPNRAERPRMHDFRHRFATRTLMHWYRSGENPERRLPILSTYLGHAHVSDTYWYLNNWPELMREGMRRLERRWERRS